MHHSFREFLSLVFTTSLFMTCGRVFARARLRGDVVQCPWHGSRFDVKSGNVVGGPAKKPVKQYKVHVDGEDIEVTE